MRILFVAMADSVHTARWINQISNQGWDLHIFPSYDTFDFHSDLTKVTVHGSFFNAEYKNPKLHRRGISIPKWLLPYKLRVLNKELYLNSFFSGYLRNFIESYLPWYRVNRLSKLIKTIKPDIIHSLEIQHAGYLTLKAKNKLKGKFPKWIVTNWGSDIYYFGKKAEHQPLIKEVLLECDYYSCECDRDIKLAQNFCLKGKVLPVLPNSGGIKIAEIEKLRDPHPPSKRKYIAIKGYQNWAGRASVALKALEICADIIKDYRIFMYSPEYASLEAAEIFTKHTGIKIDILPRTTSHQEIMALHGKSRISIGLSISDAISTSFLEAIAMGSFPIQSNTSCANEWVKDGITGLLVPPDNVKIIADAITKALKDDHLVDRAQIINYQTVKKRLNYDLIKKTAISFYLRVQQNDR
jgi:glycosyltransferase involved in cell wall biosynthesis